MTKDSGPTLVPIVVGVPRGGADAAVRAGAAEALRTGRPLDLVHVAPDSEGYDVVLGQDSLLVASQWAHRIGGSLVVRPRLLRGSVLPTLVDAIEGAALVVLERRRSAELRRLAGSATESVADATDIPMLVVPARWVESQHGVVTVGVDPRAIDEAALGTAITQARLRGAVLRVVVAADEGARDAVAAQFDRMGGDACDLAIEVASDPADVALLAAASSSDLMVLGRHRPAVPSGSRLGPVARRVLRGAHCPVLLTHPSHVHEIHQRKADDGRNVHVRH